MNGDGSSDYDRRITVYDPARRRIEAAPLVIEGQAPPTNWWPWLVLAGAAAAAWWLAREERRGRPFSGATT